MIPNLIEIFKIDDILLILQSAALMQALGHSVLQPPPMNGTSGDKQSVNADQITAIAQDVRQG